MGINEIKKKAVFLDRDGTIIKYDDLITKSSQITLLPGAGRAIKELNQRDFLVIVATNQPVVARGLITPEGVRGLHRFIEKKLARFGASIDAWYFCPHHPEATLKRYRMACDCRKPKPGMFKEAVKKFNIDTRKSYSIGDGIIDAVAGKRAGLKTIQVKTGPGHERLDKIYKNKAKPDFRVKDLSAALRVIKAKRVA